MSGWETYLEWSSYGRVRSHDLPEDVYMAARAHAVALAGGPQDFDAGSWFSVIGAVLHVRLA